ncbi:MAG: methyltransferase domain-containing protein [Actinomycetota bacterium]|nr:methyltransferase domain-containing protein [Actinomycetota bacterium]
MRGWTWAHVRHGARVLRRGRAPAATVYDSLGADFFLSAAPGWLNLGLWEGPGGEAEAPAAARRLADTLAARLPRGGVVADVGNGLGAQDPVIAERARPRRLLALNVTESQLRAGRRRLADADALAVVGDATRLPLADGCADGVISVEAAFHFPSRTAFFGEVHRVLRPGGVLVASDFSAQRRPRTPVEWVAAMSSVRFWGLRPDVLVDAATMAAQLRAAGLVDVAVARCGHRVIDPFLVFARERLAGRPEVPRLQRWAARAMVGQWALLRRRGLMDYVLVRAVKPPARLVSASSPATEA